jgi:ABC-type Fe3+-siderophore transport system permease subunit
MTIVETTASSGAVLGIVFVLLLQQLGLIALSDLWTTLIAFLVGIVVGALIFGIVGELVERNR